MHDERIASPLRQFMARSFDGRTLADSDDIFALGFANSLFAMQLVAFVESQFGIEIDSDDLEMENFRSIEAITRLVERKQPAAAQA